MSESESNRQLFGLLRDHFSYGELADLARTFEVELDSLQGTTRSAKCRSLVLSLASQDRLPQLLDKMKALRPGIAEIQDLTLLPSFGRREVVSTDRVGLSEPDQRSRQDHLPDVASEYIGLFRLLADQLSEGELLMLCFDVGIDYENLPGQDQARKAKELLLYLDRRKRVSLADDSFALLVVAGMASRPDLDWLEASGIEAGREETPETHREGFNTVAIRSLLLSCFSTYNELDVFCQRHFPHAHRSLNVSLSLPENAQALLGFCERRGRLQELLDIIDELYPSQFDQFTPYTVD